MSGKGSRQRKPQVPQSIVDANWETIFGKKIKFNEVTEEERKQAESVFYDDEKVNLNIEFKTVSSEEPEYNVKDSTQGG